MRIIAKDDQWVVIHAGKLVHSDALSDNDRAAAGPGQETRANEPKAGSDELIATWQLKFKLSANEAAFLRKKRSDRVILQRQDFGGRPVSGNMNVESILKPRTFNRVGGVLIADKPDATPWGKCIHPGCGERI